MNRTASLKRATALPLSLTMAQLQDIVESKLREILEGRLASKQ